MGNRGAENAHQLSASESDDEVALRQEAQRFASWDLRKWHDEIFEVLKHSKGYFEQIAAITDDYDTTLLAHFCKHQSWNIVINELLFHVAPPFLQFSYASGDTPEDEVMRQNKGSAVPA